MCNLRRIITIIYLLSRFGSRDGVGVTQPSGPRKSLLLVRCLLLGILCLLFASCASRRLSAQQRLEQAQKKAFEATYQEVFFAVAEVLSQDFTLAKVDPELGAIETEPKSNVVLNTGEFQGVYNLKVKSFVSALDDKHTEVHIRVLSGRLIDFAENRWEYQDFGTPQYYKEYFNVIQEALLGRREVPQRAIDK